MKWNETGVSGSVSLRTTWGTESRLHVSPADMLQDHLNAVSTACFMSLNQTECRRLSDGRLGEIFRWNINIFALLCLLCTQCWKLFLEKVFSHPHLWTYLPAASTSPCMPPFFSTSLLASSCSVEVPVVSVHCVHEAQFCVKATIG